MAGEDKFKTTVTAGVHTVRELTKNDFWIKSEEGRDVLVKDKYRQAFRFKINTLSSSSSCTTEASRASALVHMDDEDLALMLAVDEWSYRFPNIVAKEQLIKILSPGSSDENPHGTLHMVYKEMQATSPMVANRKFTVLRTCLQIDQGTWVIAELSHVSPPNTYRRLPSGCLIERITEDVSKVTWVEHMEVDEPLPNRSGFAFAAERMVAWLERSCERGSDMNATCRIIGLQRDAIPMVANRKFTVLRTCLQIDQGTWVIAELSHVSPPNTYRRLPSGCLIERITEDVSKVTWVEHMEVDEPLPNRSGFAFAAERMVAWLERSCERGSDMNATCRIKDPEGKEVPWTLEKLSLMWFGESMVRGLFENVGPNEDCHSTLWRSVTGSEDMKVYASLYKSSANFEVAGGVVTFGVRHSPELVLETLGDERTHHEWDVLGGLTKLNTFKKYSTGGDTRNSISASMIDGSTSEILIKEVNVNRSGSLVLWSTVSMKDFDVMSHGRESPEDSALIFRFFHSPPIGPQPLPIQTVGRVKQALEKHQPPSPGGDWAKLRSSSCKTSYECLNWS
ncbi:START domain-containing protein [Tanacetum coccineum]